METRKTKIEPCGKCSGSGIVTKYKKHAEFGNRLIASGMITCTECNGAKKIKVEYELVTSWRKVKYNGTHN